MENSEYHYTVTLHAIGNDAGNIDQHSFTGAGYSPGSAHAGLIGEFGNGAADAISNFGDGRRIVYGDEAPDLKKILLVALMSGLSTVSQS